MLHTPSRDILILVTIGVRYLIQELLFEFDLTIENLGQNALPNLVKPWMLLTSLTSNILENLSPCFIHLAVIS